VTTADLIAAAVLFGPATLAAPALAYRIITDRRQDAAVLAVLAEHHTTPAAPPDGGQPQPDGGGLAEVVAFPARRVA
jgi:hypothetical protein